uniref:MSL3 chromodomain-like domain-containing protein n=1 Tax=Lepeophtheirus salmonis TaxID=72036 RepID=A0A0K2SX98_LEPSM
METKSSGSANIGIFQPNEWVLCYEPDPCKVKVIYNAKILEIEDGEYLVHFRGWNSSWDRRVTQEFLLKVSFSLFPPVLPPSNDASHHNVVHLVKLSPNEYNWDGVDSFTNLRFINISHHFDITQVMI